MLMRVALAIHMNNLEYAVDTCKMLSNGVFTHATPTQLLLGCQNWRDASDAAESKPTVRRPF